jgi:hypothetical protein
MSSQQEKNPLTAKVEGGELIIRIGVDTLAYAATIGNRFHYFDERKNEYIRSVAITDATQFAKDVGHAMLNQAEDGSSALTNFIDQMAEDAMGDGSEGCAYGQRIKFGERSADEKFWYTIPSKSHTEDAKHPEKVGE